MDKKRMYLILIIIASAILAGLIILAVYISIKPAQKTKPDKNQTETTAQAADATEDAASQPEDTTGEETTTPEDTTGTTEVETTTGEETTAPTEKNDSGKQDPGNEDPGEDEKNEEDTGDSGDSGTVTPPPTPTEPTLPDVYPYNVTYKEYLDMTEDAQIAFYKDFKNHDEFKKWRTAAKKEYDENKVEIEIGEDGVIDLDKITGKN